MPVHWYPGERIPKLLLPGPCIHCWSSALQKAAGIAPPPVASRGTDGNFSALGWFYQLRPSLDVSALPLDRDTSSQGTSLFQLLERMSQLPQSPLVSSPDTVITSCSCTKCWELKNQRWKSWLEEGGNLFISLYLKLTILGTAPCMFWTFCTP